MNDDSVNGAKMRALLYCNALIHRLLPYAQNGPLWDYP